jgi:hypothetical protein
MKIIYLESTLNYMFSQEKERESTIKLVESGMLKELDSGEKYLVIKTKE